jgi:glutamyl-tRNA(Gln) amidotransferase subunit D
MKPTVGDRVLVETETKKLEGVMMPSAIKTSIVVKLDTGYNVGVPQSKVKGIKVLKKYKAPVEKKGKLKSSKNKKTIAILHTGGTIASKVDYETGGVIARYSPEELLAQFPELGDVVNIKSRLLSNMWSEDMRFDHYNVMAKEIEKEIKAGVDGIIITHGTDTIHYTSAALSFMLENLSVPVLLVGAQRSSDRGSSDAAMNLMSAATFISQSDFAEVGVCMHKSSGDGLNVILPGLKTRKIHSSRRDAFKAINAQAFAEVEHNSWKVKLIDTHFRRRNKGVLKLRLFKNVKVGLLKVRPHLLASEVKFYEKYDGLVVEGTGLGHMPIHKTDRYTQENAAVFDALKKVAAKIPVAMTTQTIFGRVNMNVYSTGRELQEIGLMGNQLDMIAEVAYIKLAWLLSNYPKKVKEMYAQNLRGEFNERLSSTFL